MIKYQNKLSFTVLVELMECLQTEQPRFFLPNSELNLIEQSGDLIIIIDAITCSMLVLSNVIVIQNSLAHAQQKAVVLTRSLYTSSKRIKNHAPTNPTTKMLMSVQSS